jgi:microcystin degradation protein MlrC
METKRMRVALTGLWHETHTFATVQTSLQDFVDFEYLAGPDILDYHRGKRTGIGGCIAAAEQSGLTLIPIVSAGALPSGKVVAAVYQRLFAEIITGIKAHLPFDGVILSLHGAMVSEDEDDVEAALVRAVRTIVGPDVPIAVTTDLHGNHSRAILGADVVVGYDTYPHVDIFERGVEAVQLLARMIRERIRPQAAMIRLPLLASVQGMDTAREPMAGLMALAHEIERDPAVLNVTVAAGFPYADVERAGFSFIVHTDGDGELAGQFAQKLAAHAWAAREAFQVRNIPVVEAVRRAIAEPAGPVILIDVADNIGGGCPGDGTELLRELLKHEVRPSIVTLADPEAVERACTVGLGSEISLLVGGKVDNWHGEPVAVQGSVQNISDGRFIQKGSWMTGREMNMGRSVVLNCQNGGVRLLLTERKTVPFDAEQLRSQSIQPESEHIIVVKSAVAWQAAYGDIARLAIPVDTPGLCTTHLERFNYRKLRRPIYPLDPEMVWSDEAEQRPPTNTM